MTSWHVSPGPGGGDWAAGDDGSDGLSKRTPLLTVQQAVALAGEGDTIIVGRGSHQAPDLDAAVELAQRKKIQFIIL